MKKLFLVYILQVIVLIPAEAQMVRERVQAERPVDNTFFSQKMAVLQTTETISSGELAMSIMHSFSEVRDGVDGFWGLDNFANIRLGLDYGITNSFSAGIGRSRVDKLVDIRFKYTLLRQTTSGKTPVSLSVIGNMGANVAKNPGPDITTNDRISYMLSVLAARKLNDKISVQVSPVFIHFNLSGFQEQNNQLALGLMARYRLSPTTAIGIEAAPVLAGASTFSYTHAALNYEIETGGHVFQLFFTTSQGLNEQYAIARNRNPVFRDGEPVFRFGFNVNRMFKLNR